MHCYSIIYTLLCGLLSPAIFCMDSIRPLWTNPLMRYARDGNIEKVQSYLQKTALSSAPPNLLSEALLAMSGPFVPRPSQYKRAQFLKIAQLLIAHRAEVNYSGSTSSPLIKACQHRNDTALVRILLEHGADVHQHNGLPLRQACRAGNLSTVRLLCSYKADPNCSDSNNKSCPLSEAVKSREIPTIDFLLSYGVDPNTLAHRKMYPLIIITKHSQPFASDYRIIQLLLEHNANPFLRDEQDNAIIDYLLAKLASLPELTDAEQTNLEHAEHDATQRSKNTILWDLVKHLHFVGPNQHGSKYADIQFVYTLCQYGYWDVLPWLFTSQYYAGRAQHAVRTILTKTKTPPQAPSHKTSFAQKARQLWKMVWQREQL